HHHRHHGLRELHPDRILVRHVVVAPGRHTTTPDGFGEIVEVLLQLRPQEKSRGRAQIRWRPLAQEGRRFGHELIGIIGLCEETDISSYGAKTASLTQTPGERRSKKLRACSATWREEMACASAGKMALYVPRRTPVSKGGKVDDPPEAAAII